MKHMKNILLFLFSVLFLISSNVFGIELVYDVYKVDKPAPTVIIGHACGGLAVGHETSWARQLNRWGFNVVVLDSFTPRRAREVCRLPMQVPTWSRSEETYKMAEFIKKQPWHEGKVVYIGFSHGGSTAVYMATDRSNKNIDAAVAYYPYCGRDYGREISTSSPRIKLMLALAKRDDWTPYGPCLGEDKNLEIHLYENATHSFDQQFPGWTSTYLGYFMQHDPQANEDSRVATRRFFKKYLEGVEEDDAIARAEFIRPAVVFAPVIDRASLLPDLAEPTEEDVRAYEKKQKPKK
jgi:dienelactone hydrolase